MRKKPLEENIARMKTLGYSEYEARVYVGLLQKSPATAYEISKITGIARANAYGTCESLVAKNAVQMIKDRPVRYVPVPPDLLLSNIASETKSTCDAIAKSLMEFQPATEQAYIWSFEGAASVDAKVREIISGAQDRIWIKASSEVLEKHADAIQSAMAANSNLECLIVLFGQQAGKFRFNDRTTVYLHEGTGVRLGNADNLFTMAIDSKETLTARIGDKVEAAYTKNEPIVTMAETVIRHDVYMAEIFLALGNQIEDLFGPHLRDLRKKHFSQSQFDLFSRNLAAT